MLQFLRSNKKRVAAGVVAAAFAVVGLQIFVSSSAATAVLSAEPERGTLASGAVTAADTTASGGSAVRFSSAMKIYRGSTHDHTSCCNNHSEEIPPKTAAEIFRQAKIARDMDWSVLTEHSGSTGPTSKGLDSAVFYSDVRAQAAAHTDSTFVGIAGMEFSDNDGNAANYGPGHMTGAGTDTWMSADGITIGGKTLQDFLVAQAAAGKRAFGGFNHPASTGHPAMAAALLSPERRNIMVMSEVFNNMESAEDAKHYLGWIVGLDRGWRLGPTCGLDSHGSMWIDLVTDSGPCRTGLLAPSLTPANIYDALMARRMFATRNTNTTLTYKANNKWMGSSLGTPTATPSVAFDITASDPDIGNPANRITKLEIRTQGGALVQAHTVATPAHTVSWKPTIATNGMKYFYVLLYNGERVTHTALAAPVWMD